MSLASVPSASYSASASGPKGNSAVSAAQSVCLCIFPLFYPSPILLEAQDRLRDKFDEDGRGVLLLHRRTTTFYTLYVADVTGLLFIKSGGVQKITVLTKWGKGLQIAQEFRLCGVLIWPLVSEKKYRNENPA